MRSIELSLTLFFAACGAHAPQSQPMQRQKSGGGFNLGEPERQRASDEVVLIATAATGVLVVGGLIWWALSGDDDPPSAAKPKGNRRPTYDDMDLDKIFDR